MKTRTKVAIVTSFAIVLTGLGVAGVSLASGMKERHGGGSSHGMHMGMDGGHGSGHHGGQGMMRMFDGFDGNGDGKLTQAEIDDTRAARLARFDTDGDGSVNLKEYQALWLDAMREKMVDRFQKLDADGDAMVTKDEFAEPFAGAVRYMDRSGDGMLSRDDMKSLHRSMGDRQGRMMRDDDDDD